MVSDHQKWSDFQKNTQTLKVARSLREGGGLFDQILCNHAKGAHAGLYKTVCLGLRVRAHISASIQVHVITHTLLLYVRVLMLYSLYGLSEERQQH